MASTEPKLFDMKAATLEEWKEFRSTFESDMKQMNWERKTRVEKIDELLSRLGEFGRAMFNTFPSIKKPRKLKEVLRIFETYFTKKHNSTLQVMGVPAKGNGEASTSTCVGTFIKIAPTEPKPFDTRNSNLEDWKEFRSTFKRYVDSPSCDNRTEEGKVALFLSLMGERGIELYITFPSSGDRAAWLLNTVMDKFEAHYKTMNSVIEDREEFYETRQLKGETFNNFLARVEKSASKCDFCNQTCIDQMVRDRVVLGIRDKKLKIKLVKMKAVSLKKAIIFCRRAEQSDE